MEQLTRLRGGLAWLNRTARERYGAADFPALTTAQKREICDEICFEPDALAELKPQARFFDAFRDMCSTGFWTTDEGMRDLGYMGNVPLPSFDGPPPEVLERLGLARGGSGVRARRRQAMTSSYSRPPARSPATCSAPRSRASLEVVFLMGTAAGNEAAREALERLSS